MTLAVRLNEELDHCIEGSSLVDDLRPNVAYGLGSSSMGEAEPSRYSSTPLTVAVGHLRPRRCARKVTGASLGQPSIRI